MMITEIWKKFVAVGIKIRLRKRYQIRVCSANSVNALCVIGMLCSVVFLPSSIRADAAPSTKVERSGVESILDKLESRLTQLEHQSLGLPTGDDAFTSIEDDVPNLKIRGSSSISGEVKEMKNIRTIATAIAKLTVEVDELLADIQRTKRKVLKNSQIDNFVELEAKLNDSSSAAIKSLTVRIDGYGVYGLTESSGFWIPSGRIPLYAGPLQPGSHRVDVEARLVMKRTEGLPLNNDVYRLVNKSFEIKIPQSSFRKKWVVEIMPTANSNGIDSVKIAESNMN